MNLGPAPPNNAMNSLLTVRGLFKKICSTCKSKGLQVIDIHLLEKQ